MVGKIDWYNEFVNKNYKPKSNDVKVLFKYTPAEGLSKEEVIGRVASESSSGTWTTLANKPKLLKKVMAYGYDFDKEYVKIAYPRILFEDGSVPGMLSGIAGNIFGMKAVQGLRLQDAELPMDYIKGFKGPRFGQTAIQKIFKRKYGPVTSVVPKPKVGYTSKEHAYFVAKQVWSGGIDCVKDDENLTNQKFNKFTDRVKYLAKVRDKVMKDTGDVKDAFINCTAPTLKEMEKRVKMVHDYGFNYFMIDLVVSGFTAVGTAAELSYDYKMGIHGHRAMHAAFTKNPDHGISMLFLAKLYRLMGVDNIHTGTVVGKLDGNEKEIIAMKDMLVEQNLGVVKNIRMPQKWGSIKPCLPISSGGLHPGLLPAVFDVYGTVNIGLQLGGGTQGHPDGIEAGARAMMQAIEAHKQGISLKEYAKTHKELARALEKWGDMKPI
jgi:ribulose-bisphosphate carboxylase large chain